MHADIMPFTHSSFPSRASYWAISLGSNGKTSLSHKIAFPLFCITHDWEHQPKTDLIKKVLSLNGHNSISEGRILCLLFSWCHLQHFPSAALLMWLCTSELVCCPPSRSSDWCAWSAWLGERYQVFKTVMPFSTQWCKILIQNYSDC